MTDFQRSVMSELATLLDTELGSAIEQVLPEWPSANVEMDLPSITLTLAGNPEFTPHAPVAFSLGAVTDHQSSNKYVVGQYDFRVQLDIWAKYKKQRSSLYEAVFNILRPTTGTGLVLQLTDYHNVYCPVSLDGFGHSDNQGSAMNAEWRATVFLVGTCMAVNTSTDYIITQVPEITVELPITEIEE